MKNGVKNNHVNTEIRRIIFIGLFEQPFKVEEEN